jgi:hypothetical protein
VSERLVYESPWLWSIFDPARLSAGTYSDGGPAGRNWANGASAPTIQANYLASGLPAAVFNGSSNYVTASHFAPLGNFSAVFLAEMDVTWSAGDNITRALCAGQFGTGVSQIFAMYGLNRRIRIDSQGGASGNSGLVTLGTPSVLAFSVNTRASTLAVRVNGSAWTSAVMTSGQVPFRNEYQLGARLGNGATRAGFYLGGVFRGLIFKAALDDSRHTQTLADAEGALRAAADTQSGFMSVLTQPSTTGTSGNNLASQPRFNVLTTAGAVDTSYTGNVTISAQGAGALGGTLTRACVAGVSTFTGISIIGAGVTQIIAKAAGRGSVACNRTTIT